MSKQNSPPKKKHTDVIKRRAWFMLFAVFFVGFLVLIARLFQIQVIEGPEYKARALQQRTTAQTLEPRRGAIYDRNEKVLAQSAAVWNVCISPEDISEEQLPDIAKNLAEILEVSEADILALADQEGIYYAKIKSKVDNTTREKVENYVKAGFKGDTSQKIKGIFFEDDTKRYYVYDNLASNVIGFVNDENVGAYGLEAYYNDILSGAPGVDVSGRNPRDLKIADSSTFDAQDGYSIVLTIDENIQSILEKHLEMAVVEHDVQNRATGIIMNIKTGEILAMSNKPDFNPNNPQAIYDPAAQALLDALDPESDEYKTLRTQLRYEQWGNKAVSHAYEPGSVYKIVTASIALEEKHTFPNDHFFCSGSIEVADRTMNCHRLQGHGAQNFNDIVKDSCNPAFVTLGMRNGPEVTYKYMTDFGLGKTTGIDLPGEDVGILHTAGSLASQGQVPLASTSFGQSFTTTPIQLITAVSAAVNGGYLVEPYVVRQIMDSQGNVIETIQPNIKRQVVSEDTSALMREAVEMVVTDGSGKHAAVPGYRIGGKTGTSEKLEQAEDEKKQYVLSFVGFAPMDDPVYACLVALDEPYVANPWGSVIAAPVVGAIFQEMLPYVGVEAYLTDEELAEIPVDMPYLIEMKPHDAQAELTAMGLKTRIMGQGSTVLRQIPLSGQIIRKGGTVTLFTDEDSLNTNISMPDLEGLPLEQAQAELTKRDLNLEVQGVQDAGVETVVGTQWPTAGTIVTTADAVILTMEVVENEYATDIMDEHIPVPKPKTPKDDRWEEVQDGDITDWDGWDEDLEGENIFYQEPTAPETEKKENTTPKTPEKSPSGEVIDGDPW